MKDAYSEFLLLQRYDAAFPFGLLGVCETCAVI